MEASTAIEKVGAEELALASKVRGKVDTASLKVPLVKLAQALTNEVQAKRAEAGTFINSVTGESYGDSFEFIIADTFQGRFARIKGEGYNAQGPVVPDNWPPQYAGQAFADLDDAEENFKAAVNAGKQEFGHGPPISTTHNYVGLIVGDDFEERAAENRLLPVRVSLMRKNAKAAQTIDYLLLTWPAPWARLVKLTAVGDKNDEGAFFVAQASEGETATTAQRSAAGEPRPGRPVGQAGAAGRRRRRGQAGEAGRRRGRPGGLTTAPLSARQGPSEPPSALRFTPSLQPGRRGAPTSRKEQHDPIGSIPEDREILRARRHERAVRADRRRTEARLRAPSSRSPRTPP